MNYTNHLIKKKKWKKPFLIILSIDKTKSAPEGDVYDGPTGGS